MHSILGILNETPGQKILFTETGPYVHDNRRRLAKKAEEWKASHLLFVDHDMVFQPDAVRRLLAVNADIAGVNYHTRSLPLVSTVKFAQGHATPASLADFPTEPFACASVGTGLMLVRMDVFAQVPQPWFFFELMPDGSVRTGEDCWFCLKAGQAGCTVVCDPRIPVKHLGDFPY